MGGISLQCTTQLTFRYGWLISMTNFRLSPSQYLTSWLP
ncbi:hypothetical protein FF1_026744 [Malus domestica]